MIFASPFYAFSKDHKQIIDTKFKNIKILMYCPNNKVCCHGVNALQVVF